MTFQKNKYPVIAVTGANGWLGKRLLHALIEGIPGVDVMDKVDVRVRCLVQPGEQTVELRQLGAEIVYGDIRDPDASSDLLEECAGGALFHIAGIIHPPGRTRYFHEINVEGTTNLCAAAKAADIQRMVVVSSNSPLGFNATNDQVFTEESPYSPYVGYGKSKWLMEQFLQQEMRKSGEMGIVIIRTPWFYGPGQPARQTLFFTMIKNGRFPILGGGMNRRSMAYTDSLSLGLILSAFSQNAAGEIYWIADERPYSMLEIVDTIKSVLKDDFGFQIVERNLFAPSIVGDIAEIADRSIQALGLYHQKVHVLAEMNKTIACDITKAKRELGYQPLLELREGMRRSVQWCLEHNLVI